MLTLDLACVGLTLGQHPPTVVREADHEATVPCKETEGGNSPTLFDTDEDMFVIQGWIVDDPEALAQLALPEGRDGC